ncbi:MAG: response regulator transcription factor [Chloroflexi bacterium]|nr:response regulator transcription factor [Chloroflexota bacterium]
MAPISVVLADDHLLFRKGIQALLSARSEFQVVAEASNGTEAVERTRELRPDVVLMDIHMPLMDGLHATQEIKESRPETRVLILTVSEEDEDLFSAIRVGADGYVLKNMSPEALIERLLEVARGEAPLSPVIAGKMLRQFRRQAALDMPAGSVASLTRREREVLTLVAQGASNKEVADRLYLTEGTVKNHLHKILDRLHLHNRVQATALAIQEGLTTAARDEEDPD